MLSSTKRNFTIPSSFGAKFFAGPVISDFNADAFLDILIPACQDEECLTVTTCLLWTKGKWINFPLDLKVI